MSVRKVIGMWLVTRLFAWFGAVLDRRRAAAAAPVVPQPAAPAPPAARSGPEPIVEIRSSASHLARQPLLQQWWALVKAAATSWSDDYAPSMGAAIAYYTLFSIAPLMLIVISIAGLVFGEEAARGSILVQLRGLLGTDGAAAVEGLLQSASKPANGIAGSLFGVLTLIIGATTVFGELQNSLDRIWRAPVRPPGGVWSMVRARLLSFGMILTIGFLLIVSLVASAALSAVGAVASNAFAGWDVLLHLLNLLLGFGLTTAAFAAIYKIMPRVHIAWGDVWVGAAVTSVLFTLGRFLIGLYLGKSGVVSGFGAASSIVVLLIWVYYSAQIFLIGAEFTWVYAHSFGSLRGRPIAKPGQPRPAR